MTLHLPIETGAVVRIVAAVIREYPDAVVGYPHLTSALVVEADPDAHLRRGEPSDLPTEPSEGNVGDGAHPDREARL